MPAGAMLLLHGVGSTLVCSTSFTSVTRFVSASSSVSVRVRADSTVRLSGVRNFPPSIEHPRFRLRGGRIRSLSASFGDHDAAAPSESVFPRIHVKDPYQRLGITREASEEEIQAARNFLISKYAGHKPSIDAIEAAHDKIIMQKFFERKNPRVDVGKKLREVKQSRLIKFITSRFQAPAGRVILKTASSFILLGVLSVLFPTEDGPTLQVAISLAATIYFIHERLRSRLRAALYGFGSFFASWLIGTLLMVSVVPPLLKGPRAFEVTTSLITYVLLWVSSTYLK